MGVSVLLDTHALLWVLMSPDKLGTKVRRLVMDRATTVLVSAASAWEIATKHRLGKLEHAGDVVVHYADHLRALGAEDVSITAHHALLAGGFEVDHRDPFDRMIAAQALTLGVPVATNDPAFRLFPCRTMW